VWGGPGVDPWKNPTDRTKLGWKWSVLTDRQGTGQMLVVHGS